MSESESGANSEWIGSEADDKPDPEEQPDPSVGDAGVDPVDSDPIMQPEARGTDPQPFPLESWGDDEP